MAISRRFALSMLPILLLGGGSAAALDPVADEALAPVRPCAGRDVAVGGKSLHFVICSGRRHGPVVLLEAGATLDSTEWTAVTAELAGRTDATIIAYDRAGMGKSQALEAPYDIVQEVDRLHAALRKLRQSRPLLLVGHSYGGYLVQLYAHRHRADVMGLVYVDANTVEGIGGIEGAKALIDSVIEADRKGKGKFNDMRLAHGYVVATETMTRVPPPIGLPVTVVTQGAADLPMSDPGAKRWRDGHRALAAATGGRMVYADGAGHFIPTEKPKIVADAILATLQAAHARATRRD
ncbi:alpha/beta fold hydrolase [Sphingomonas sp. MS122]|uniref:alpha/beta fold hydrolase n=1 Tax=Sphingomonas sp. MS122 TaxID=3412683 RepID=UPI003C2FA6ED